VATTILCGGIRVTGEHSEASEFHFWKAISQLESPDPVTFESAYAELEERAGELAPDIVAAARAAKGAELRVRLAELLGATGGPGVDAGAVQLLAAFLREPDPRLQRTAAHSLVSLSTEEAVRLADQYYRGRHRDQAS
jgi:HEAT repeat protein